MITYDNVDLLKRCIDQKRPFEGAMLQEVKDYYRIGLTWSSNAIEGNTLTESETKILLEDGLTVGGKPLKDTFETIGHAKAYDFMFTLLHKDKITKDDICTMHSMFYQNIEAEYAGKYRTTPVFITGSKYPVCQTEKIPYEMENLFQWVETKRNNFHPVEFAALLHKKLVFIHPFKDGNGRISRLAMNTALIQKGYLPVIIPPILRSIYIQSLEKAHKDDCMFLEFIAERVFESEKDFMRLLNLPLPSQIPSEKTKIPDYLKDNGNKPHRPRR